MSSSGVSNSSYKQDTERRNNNEAFDDSSTRVFVFKEVSSLDEDDSCNLGRTTSWSNKLGLVKKIKLSEDGTALVPETFENFCDLHKNVRQKHERPYSSEARKVSKPHLQPTAERGLKKQPRPTTASKLSDIAVNKYPDSIFKVYIPEGNRVIKKKRVVPLVDIKPSTPVRTGPSSRGFDEQGHARIGKNPNLRAVGPPLKTKHSIPQQALQNTERRLNKAAGENSEPQFQTPKKMTHITDISLTKEQEKKRIREREVMKKRTMDVVKMAFPVTGNEDAKSNESVGLGYGSEMSGDENSRQKECPSKSKSSLKSYSSGTSFGQGVTRKRSVTWGENECSDSPSQRHGDNKPSLRRKKRIIHGHRILSSSHIARTDLRSSSRSKLLPGSRNNGKSSKGVVANTYKREKKKIMKPRMLNESQDSTDKNENNNKSTFTRKTATSDDSYSESDRKDESESEDRYSKERMPTKKHVKNKKSFRRCDCGRVIKKNEIESGNEIKPISDPNTKTNKENKDGQCGNQKHLLSDREDSFEIKRTAIIIKHSTKDAHSGMDDFEKNDHQLESDLDPKTQSCDDEEMFHMKRGRSTPSLRKISTMDCSYGSSDSELCFPKDNNKHNSDKGPLKKISGEIIEEKPLRKIFDSSNIQNAVTENELAAIETSGENIPESKSCSGSKIAVLESKQNLEIDETFTEGFKTSQLEMKSTNVEELRNMQDAQLKNSAEEDSSKENLIKEDCILNLKTVVQVQSEQTKDNLQNAKITSSHCNALSLFTDHLSNDYVLVDAYSVVTNSSKSLTREQSSSMPLIREVPMLNLSYDEKTMKQDAQRIEKKCDLPKKAPKSATDISNESNTSALTHPSREKCNLHDKTTDDDYSQEEQLQNDYSQSFKVKSNIQHSGKTRDPSLRIQSNVHDTKNSNSIVTSHCKMISSGKQKPVLPPQLKQILNRNPSEKNNIISEKNPSPPSQKPTEDRKLHLQKMLSRGESVGGSRKANQIMEKWNSTQKSISQRKEKMLASIRDTRHLETNRIPATVSKDIVVRPLPHYANRNNHQVGYQVIQPTEKVSSIQKNPVILEDAAVLSSNETQQIEQCETANEDDASLSGKDDFETTIVIPGSRIPQPYSSTNILDPSDRHLDESLTPCTNENTPEKPLCEWPDSGIIALPFKKNLNTERKHDPNRAQPKISDVDEEIPERDLSVSSPLASLKTDKKSPEVYINARSSVSDVDSTYGSTQSNASNNESSNCSHVHSQSVGALYSEEIDLTIETTIPSIPSMREEQETVLTLTRNVLPKSASYSRPSSYERPKSRRSKASSSGSSRRSVEPTGRPPSRKPHMLDTTDEDSDQEIITSCSPYHAECYMRNAKEPLKKAPPSRMYSTLNHTPHPGQESIKTAIRDLNAVKENSRSNILCSDRPMSSGQCSSRGGGYQSCSSRPSSGKPNMPKMSPGSVKILKEKSRNAAQRSGTPDNINARENIVENRYAKLSPWTQSTRRQESDKEPSFPLQNQRTPRAAHKNFPGRRSGNEKPPFRYFSHNKNDEDDTWNLQKLKNFVVNKAIENYLPPWERVDLTPPESALRERASNERRLGIKSRITRASSPQSNEIQPTYGRDSGTATPRGSVSPVSATSGRCRTPIGGRTPLGSKTPISPRTPVGERTPVDCRTPGRRSPIGNMSPVARSRTPVRNRTPNPSERKPMEQRTPAEKNLYPRKDEKLLQEKNG